MREVFGLAELFFKLAAEFLPVRCLKVFDFDGTLASTSGLPVITNLATGEKVRVTQEFIRETFPELVEKLEKGEDQENLVKIKDFVFIKKPPPGWSDLDWQAEFGGELVEPVIKNEKILAEMQAAAAGNNKVIVLTARPQSSAGTIRNFLKDNGIEEVKIIGLGSGIASRKADKIKEILELEGIRRVEFWDDSAGCLDAVNILEQDWNQENITDPISVACYKVKMEN